VSGLALGWAFAQLLAAGAIVAGALGAGIVLAARGERRRVVALPHAAPRGRLSPQTLALMERSTAGID
jgi:hypothetical protein